MRSICTAVLLSLCLVSAANAAPSITSASGGVIVGTNFGTKSTAPPIKWDDFEDGTADTLLGDTDSSWLKRSTEGAQYSDTLSHSGSLSVFDDPFVTDSTGYDTNYFTYSPASEAIFVSYWWRTTNADTSDYGVIKLTRANSSSAAGGDSDGVYAGAGDTGMSNMNPRAPDAPFLHYNDGVTYPNVEYITTPWNEWVRISMYKKLSTAGVADGALWADAIGSEYYEDTSIMTRAGGETFQMDTIMLGLMVANATGQFEFYIDDVYIDNSQARVEVCDEEVWDDRTHCEIQIPVTWEDGTDITYTVNNGTFVGDSTAYLFVIDEDGAVSDQDTETAGSQGYPITIAEESTASFLDGHLF